VTFAHLNLAQDSYPSLASETNAMDVIFCRNVLMYFTAARVRKVIANLHHALVDGGWLAVSPSEVSQALFPQFATRNFPGVILYQRDDQRAHGEQALRSGPVEPAPPAPAPIPDDPHFFAVPPEPPAPPDVEEPALAESPEPSRAPQTEAAMLYEQGCYAESAEVLLAVAGGLAEPESLALLTRALANQGKLAEALPWCDRWIAADKMDAGAHYLRAVILLEQGVAEPARQSLLRALYLQPDFVLPHFALGNLARRSNKSAEADRHFANALRLLERHEANDPLPASDGITAGRLTETISMMTAMQAR
jgi:chemotaxis protein methyltransferase CheR